MISKMPCQTNQLSPSTIVKTLDGMLMTIKLAEEVLNCRNSPHALDMHMRYAQWFLEPETGAHCIYIDEAGDNIWMRLSFGSSPCDVPVRRVVHGQR